MIFLSLISRTARTIFFFSSLSTTCWGSCPSKEKEIMLVLPDCSSGPYKETPDIFDNSSRII